MRDVIIDSHIDTDVDNVLEVVDASRLELCRKLLRRDSIRHALCVSYVEPLVIVMSGVEGTYIQRLSSKHKPSFHNRPSEQWMDRSVASCSLLGEFSAWSLLILREVKMLIVLVMREVNVAALLSEGRHEKERRKMVGASSYPAALCTYKMYRIRESFWKSKRENFFRRVKRRARCCSLRHDGWAGNGSCRSKIWASFRSPSPD